MDLRIKVIYLTIYTKRFLFYLITEENINIATRKRFSENPIAAFTNSTVFILLYIRLSFRFIFLAFRAWTLTKEHMIS